MNRISYLVYREKRQREKNVGLEANPNASSGGRMNYRVELGLTQTQLAEKINAKQKSISRYETGASLPSIKTLVKIAGVAGHLLDE